MKVLNLPSEPSHIINYIEDDMFIFFLYWLRDKKDYNSATDIISVVEAPHKYNKEFQQFKTEWENE